MTARLYAVAGGLLLLSACSVTPDPLNTGELVQSSKSDLKSIFQHVEPIEGELTMAGAIARALKYNLDHRARLMEEALSLNQIDLDKYELMPDVIANAGYSVRSNDDASVSKTLTTGVTGTEPSTSDKKGGYTADLSLSWSILDFGIGYYNAQQNADRKLIASERRRRVVQNLLQEVRSAFWRAASSQILEEKVKTTIREAEQALRESQQIESENLQNPLDALRYQKTLLENLRQLEGIQQELGTAYIELASLINNPPGTKFRLALPDTENLTVPEWNLELEDMEDLAFINNPDLREQIYESRIAAHETRKTILGLFPGITFTASRNYDSNSFLTNNTWGELGASTAFNLINIVTGKDNIKFSKASETVAEARRHALRMAVLAQVHIGFRQFKLTALQFERADALYRVDKKISQHISNQAQSSRQSVLEKIVSNTSATLAELRRFQTFAQAYAALGQMQSAFGADLLTDDIQLMDLTTLAGHVGELMDDHDSGASQERLIYQLRNEEIDYQKEIIENHGDETGTKVPEEEGETWGLFDFLFNF